MLAGSVPVNTGRSLTGVTTALAERDAVLKAVASPVAAMGTTVPAVPVVRSHAWKVIVLLVPAKLALGRKRTRVVASALSSSALPVAGVVSASQVVPFREYCQVPL